MKSILFALALSAVGINAQSLSTVLAPCGTACPSAPADKTITRSMPMVTESTPCPSLLVSSISMNGSNPMATSAKPVASSFTGGASQPTGAVGFAVFAVGAAVGALAI